MLALLKYALGLYIAKHAARRPNWSWVAFAATVLTGFLALLAFSCASAVSSATNTVAASAAHTGSACPLAQPGQQVGQSPGLDGQQAATASEVLRAAKDLSVPSRGWVVAIATGLQESGLKPIDYGDNAADGSSRGVFQQLAAWGPLEERMDPYRSASMFFTGGHAGQHGLLQIPGWEAMSVADAAQAVQHSAFPSAYAKHEQQATEIVTALSGSIPTSTCGGGGGPVYVAGDSITVGSEDAIRSALGSRQVTIRAEVGRRLDQGLPIMEQDQAQLMGVDVVVALCTNYGGDVATFNGEIDQVLAIASSAASVVFVTCTEWSAAQVAANAAIRAHPGIRVAEWAEPSRTPGMLGPDGIHPTTAGQKAFAAVIAAAVPSGAEIVGGYALPLPRDQIHAPLPNHHDGGTAVDITAPQGTPIYAIAAGTVAYTSEGDACGLGMVITDATGTQWMYCHSSVRVVATGSTVSTGQQIALVGSTGESTGPHLHVQIDAFGAPRCPQPFLDALVDGTVIPDLASLSTSGPCA